MNEKEKMLAGSFILHQIAKNFLKIIKSVKES